MGIVASRADGTLEAVTLTAAVAVEEMRALARAAVASAVLAAVAPTRAAAVAPARPAARGTLAVPPATFEAAVPLEEMPPPAAQRVAIDAHEEPCSGVAGVGAGPRSSWPSCR